MTGFCGELSAKEIWSTGDSCEETLREFSADSILRRKYTDYSVRVFARAIIDQRMIYRENEYLEVVHLLKLSGLGASINK